MLNKVFFLLITVFLIVLIGTQIFKKDVSIRNISDQNINSNFKIYFNDYSFPLIIVDDKDDIPYANGFLQAHLRLFQLEFLRHFSQGQLANKIDSSLLKIDFLTRRIFSVESTLDNFDTLKNKKLYQDFSNGVNSKLKSIKTLPLEFGIFDIKKDYWEAWEVYHLDQLIKNFSNSSILIDIENELINRSDLSNNIKDNYNFNSSLSGLKIEQLKALYNWFSEFRVDEILIANNINKRFSIISISDDLELPSSYLPAKFVINDSINKLNIFQAGSASPMISVQNNKTLISDYNKGIRINKYIRKGDVFFDSKLKKIDFQIQVDTLTKDNTNLKYLYKDPFNNSFLLNFDEQDTSLISLKSKFNSNLFLIADSNYFLSKDIQKKNRLKSLIESVIRFNNLELQLIINDDVDLELLEIRDYILNILDSNSNSFDQFQLTKLNMLRSWKGTSNYLNSNSSYSLSLINNVVKKSISYFLESKDLRLRSNFELELFDKIKNEYKLNDLILGEFQKENIESNEIQIDNYKNHLTKIGISLETAIPNGSENSLKHFHKSNYESGNVLTLIYDKERDLLDLQMLGGMSGELQNQNFKDLFSLWKTSGFLKIDLNNFVASDSILFTKN